MLKRLFLGLVIGIVTGGVIAAAFARGLHVLTFGDATGGVFLAYVAALLTGAVVALVAGKPIWAKGAWIEVGLKAFFGSLLAAGGMFALRRWGVSPVDLSRFNVGAGTVGSLSVTSIPILATVLSVLFELDNTDAPAEKATAKSVRAAPRVASGSSGRGVRISTDESPGEVEEEVTQPKKKLRN
jgi:hypothetical protein